MKTSPRRLALVVLCALIAAAAAAEEWPSWRGPRQDGISVEKGLPDSWDPKGENVIWHRQFIGRSTPVVMDGRVYVNGRVGQGVDRQSVLAAFDAKTGEQIWERRFNVFLSTVLFNRVGWGSPIGDSEHGSSSDWVVSGVL